MKVCANETVAVDIACAPVRVYAYVREPRNLPRWALGLCGDVALVDGEWLLATAQGPVRLRFVADNPFGVLDHSVQAADGTEVYVPMRVLANGEASTLLLTLFRSQPTDDAQFDADRAMVTADLQRLKAVLEAEIKAESQRPAGE